MTYCATLILPNPFLSNHMYRLLVMSAVCPPPPHHTKSHLCWYVINLNHSKNWSSTNVHMTWIFDNFSKHVGLVGKLVKHVIGTGVDETSCNGLSSTTKILILKRNCSWHTYNSLTPTHKISFLKRQACSRNYVYNLFDVPFEF